MKNDLAKFLKLIEEGRYYDAHEALEAFWFPRRFEENSEVKLIKGFINASVSFELLKRGRRRQADKVWANYLKYRQLLYRIDSPCYNEYHFTARVLERHQKQLFES